MQKFQQLLSITRKINAKDILFLLASVFMILLAVFFAINTKPGIPPDEHSHYDLASKYYNSVTLTIEEPYKEFNLGSSSREPSLYHIALGKILRVSDQDATYYNFRALNIILFLLYLGTLYLLLRECRLNLGAFAIFLIFLTSSIMLPFLYSAINYDNFVNLFAVLVLLSLMRYLKTMDFRYLYIYLLFSLLGGLTKESFLPLFFITFLVVSFTTLRSRSKIIELLRYATLHKFFSFIILILVFVFSYYWIANLALFGSLTPSCHDIYTQNQCESNHIYSRNVKIYDRTPLNINPELAYNYYNEWSVRMIGGIFGIFSHRSITAGRSTTVVIYYLMVIGVLLYLFHKKNRDRALDYLLLVSGFYAGVLFLKLLYVYSNSGLINLAVQGRYLFPILPILYIVIAKGIDSAIRNKMVLALAIIITCAFFLQNTHRVFFHKANFKSDAYYQTVQSRSLINRINHSVPNIPLLTL